MAEGGKPDRRSGRRSVAVSVLKAAADRNGLEIISRAELGQERQSWLEPIRSEIAALRADIGRLDTSLAGAVAGLTEAIAHVTRQSASSEDRLSRIEGAASSFVGEGERLRSDFAEAASAAVNAIRADVGLLRQELAEVGIKTINAARADIEVLAQRLAAAEEASIAAVRADFATSFHRMHSDLGQVSAALEAANRNLSNLATSTPQNMTRVNDLAERIASLLEANEKSGKEATWLRGEVERLRDLANHETAWRDEKISHLQARIQSAPGPRKTYFNLYTLGRTATHWIADALSLHPDVICVHGPDLTPYTQGETELQKTTRQQADGASLDGYNLDRYYDMLEERSYRSYGVIHGISPVDAVDNPSRYCRAYYVAGITRHPVPRIRSFVNRWSFEAANLRDRPASLEKESSASWTACKALFTELPDIPHLSFIDRLFTHAVFVTLSGEPRGRDIPVYPCERIAHDGRAFRSFFRDVTQGAVKTGDDYFRAVSKLAPIDVTQSHPMAPGVEFESWSPWARGLFGALLDHYDLAGWYQKLGYDLSFLGPRKVQRKRSRVVRTNERGVDQH